jgi:hypothetical protein
MEDPGTARPGHEKLSITLPADLAGEIRDTAGPGGVSGFIADAARYYIRRRKLMSALDLGFGAWTNGRSGDAARTASPLRRLREVGRERAERLRRLLMGDDA